MIVFNFLHVVQIHHRDTHVGAIKLIFLNRSDQYKCIVTYPLINCMFVCLYNYLYIGITLYMRVYVFNFCFQFD